MTVLITGGTGLVGSRLLRRFLAAGVECRALVRAGKELPAGATRVEGDLLEPSSLRQALTGVSAIIHLAAVFRTSDTDLIWRANLEGTRHLMAAAKAQAPGARLLMASTGQVYDAEALHPGVEDDPVNPKLPYPASKFAAENEVRGSGLTWSILRLPFVYGDEDGHMATIPRLASSFEWHPAQTFSMVHHRDVARAFELALTGVMDGQVVNITDDAPLTIYEMAKMAGASVEPSAEPLTNPWWGRMDGSRSRTLGFQPAIATAYQALREGIL